MQSNDHTLTRPTKGIAEANSLGQMTTLASDDLSQLAGGSQSHDEVASRVRMLLRTDLDHEAVCVMARDRIKWLAHRVAVLEAEALRRESAATIDVLAERRRQIEQEGWTPDHDDEHDAGELAAAGSSYALNAADQLHPYSQGDGNNIVPAIWPWDPQWWKPTVPRRDLVKAGALIIAEIERLDRQMPDTHA